MAELAGHSGHQSSLGPDRRRMAATLAGTCSLVLEPAPTRVPAVRISQSPQVALGRAIRLRREQVGLTQEALADAADLDPTSIRGLERGIANPTWDVADRIARALGLALYELARRADELETADRRPTNRLLQRLRLRRSHGPAERLRLGWRTRIN